MVDINALLINIYNQIVAYLPKLVAAIVVFIVGLWIIKGLTKLASMAMRRAKLEVSLRHFLESIVKFLLKIALFLAVVGILGVQMTSFVAILGAATLAIGLALQGSLANFAGGVLILIFKPFKVGDYIKAAGESGSVNKITIINTVLKTPDNKTIIIPNGPLANGNVTNYSAEKTRRVDFTFGVGYDDDLKKAEKVLNTIISKHKKIMKDPEPFVRVGELADSSVNFTVRVWVKAADYWDVHFDMIEQVKANFDANRISIPYPQLDVHQKK